jgi:ABC-2 type transport system ATP-binding protein
MDEPTVGLDPKSRLDLLQAVRQQVHERQCMVLWATHLVEEAQAADRVLVLNKGRLMASGSPSEVQLKLGGETLEQGFIQVTQTTRERETS